MIEGTLLRVLITRLSAIGDCIQTLPLASAIRARYPRAMIAWCVEPAAAPLVKAHPAVNRVVVVKKGWLGSPIEMLKVRQQLRALKCDIAIDPQSLSKSALAGWMSGARQRIGFSAPQGREIAPWLHTERIAKTAEHVVDGYLQLLRPLGIESPPVKFGLTPDEASLATIQTFLYQQGLHDGFMVINPGAGWDSRLWPAERYAEVAKRVGQATRVRSVVAWAGEREHAWAQQIAASSGGQAVLAPKTSLLELVALLKLSTCFVGSDTGPLHLAAALQVPCVAMFGPTRWQVSGPYGTGHICLQKAYHDGTSRERRSADNRAMCLITTDDVCQACEQTLEQARRHRFSEARRAA